MATSIGHTKMQRQGINSTKTQPKPEPPPLQEADNKRTNNVFTIMVPLTLLEKSYSDQTGRFPVRSSRGNQYVFIMYNYDTNSIHSQGIKDRHSNNIIDAWETTFKLLKFTGHAPKLHILDNECSGDLKNTFNENNIEFQLVPPYVHRVNAAERAIQTWKDHFLAGLATCDPNYPLREWDRLMPQVDITLNLLRKSRRFPNLSAYAAIWGNYDYNAHPIAPPGTRVMVYETPAQRNTFGAHGVEGWYIGPALNHYRCFTCFIPTTASRRHALTVEWFPHRVPIPKTTTEDYLKQTANDLLHILKSK
jgi:hypothetical protein